MDGSNDSRTPIPYRVKPSEWGWEVWCEDVRLATYPTRDRAVTVARKLARRFSGPVMADTVEGD